MKFIIFLIMMMPWWCRSEKETHLQIQVTSSKQQAVSHSKIALIEINSSSMVHEVVQKIKSDLERSGQCLVDIVQGHLPKTKQDIEHYCIDGYQFVLFLEGSEHNIVGRLYDCLDTTMMQGKKWCKRTDAHDWAHHIAQDIWLQLMGNPGSFLSKIAYIKKTKNAQGKRMTQLCIVDSSFDRAQDERDEKIVRSSSHIMVAPSWKADGSLIYFSQFASRNVCIGATDLQGKSWIAINRDGTNMGVSSIEGTDDVVYCHSGDIWKCAYNAANKQVEHMLITRDGSMCASPTLIKNGDIIYCAGGRIKRWNAATATTSTITDTGYCVGPAYHEPSRRLVYSQRIGHAMQLFLYDDCTKGHRQLTFSNGDKIDASWSPCGTYLAYCYTDGKVSKIMGLNCITGSQYCISPAHQYCSCPSWSPIIELH